MTRQDDMHQEQFLQMKCDGICKQIVRIQCEQDLQEMVTRAFLISERKIGRGDLSKNAMK